MTEYTSCQEAAKPQIEEFLRTPNEDLMILSAPAGCGKTWLLKDMLGTPEKINNLDGVADLDFDGCFQTAMSNKAAQVIEGITFDKHFGLFPKQDFQTGNSFRVKAGGEGNPQYNNIITIDEASMMDMNALNHVEDLTEECKIILSCDEFQLGPVGSAKSPIFNQDFRVVELITPKRQEPDSPLYKLCSQLREGVRNQVLTYLTESDQVKYIEDSEIIQFFTEMTEHDKIITYTNDSAKRMNEYVRNFKGTEGFWQKGEKLVSNGIIRKGSTIILSNEQSLNVLEVGMDVTKNAFELDCRWVTTDRGIFHVPVDAVALSRLGKKLARRKEWKEYYTLTDTVPDFRGTWSSTAHKSQGSTYNRVVINLADLVTAKYQNFDLFLRLLYVAISRAKYEVLLYGRI